MSYSLLMHDVMAPEHFHLDVKGPALRNLMAYALAMGSLDRVVIITPDDGLDGFDISSHPDCIPMADRPNPMLALDELFTYHPPNADQLVHYAALRAGAKAFAQTVLEHTPAGPDQTTVIRKIREAVMTANAAVALAPQ